jgi:hypothetical protein
MSEQCMSVEKKGWLELRQALWSHCTRDDHLSEMSSFCATLKKRAGGFLSQGFVGMKPNPAYERASGAAQSGRWAAQRARGG